MYPRCHQMTLEEYAFPFGRLDSENEWGQSALLAPWDVAEEAYAERFVNNGHPAHPVRIALTALIIKQRLKYSHEWVVLNILSKPFKYFEEIQMMCHTKALGIVQVDDAAWRCLTKE